ncbi:MAG: hypothetical protein LBV19_03025 [Streptococcaceae bacterium]|jgi:hypothetical protein|nr:hypothetical protein [Streptococcaceae bacterium]
MNLNDIITDEQVDYLKDNTDVDIKDHYSYAELNNLIDYLKTNYDEYTDESFEHDNDNQTMEEIIDALINESGDIYDDEDEV